jgi:hypothetical protein
MPRVDDVLTPKQAITFTITFGGQFSRLMWASFA